MNIISKKEALNGVFVHANRRSGMLLYTLPFNSLSDNITAIGEDFRFVRQIGCFVKILWGTNQFFISTNYFYEVDRVSVSFSHTFNGKNVVKFSARELGKKEFYIQLVRTSSVYEICFF